MIEPAGGLIPIEKIELPGDFMFRLAPREKAVVVADCDHLDRAALEVPKGS